MAGVKLSPDQLQGVQYLDEPTGREKLSPELLQGAKDLDAAAAPAPQGDPDAGQGGLRHGAGQTFARSAMDMITLGHHDEISGAIDEGIDSVIHGHMPTAEGYRQHRDVYRGEEKAGNEAHPIAHYAGMAGGTAATMLVPGLNVAKAGTVGGAAVRAGAMGALAGEGNSEGDLTKSEFGQVALDTAIGAGTGAVLGATGQKLGNVISKSGERADRTLMSDIGQRANKGVRDKMAENSANVLKTARKLGLNDVAQDAPALLDKASKAKDAVGQKIGTVYEMVDKDAGPVRVAKVIDKLAALERRYTDNGQLARARAVQSTADELITAFGDTAPTVNFHQYVSALGDKAYETLSEKASAKVNRQIAGAVNSALKEHIADAAKATPSLKEVAKALPGLNEEFGALAEITTAAKQRAKLSPYKPTGLRSFTLRGLGEAAYDNTLGKIQRPADEKLARLVRTVESRRPGLAKAAGEAQALGNNAAGMAAPQVPGMAASAAQAAFGEPDEDPKQRTAARLAEIRVGQ